MGGEGRSPQRPLRRLPEALQDGVDVLKRLVNLCSDFSTCGDELSRDETTVAFNTTEENYDFKTKLLT